MVGAAYEVSNVLGAGFVEKVYERALARELALRGLRSRSQASNSVLYKGQCVGTYAADLVVEDRVLVELKCGHVPQPALGAMYQLLEGLWSEALPAHQLPETEGRVEANHLRLTPAFSYSCAFVSIRGSNSCCFWPLCSHYLP